MQNFIKFSMLLVLASSLYGGGSYSLAFVNMKMIIQSIMMQM
ncbi:MAG: hypothetical protein ABXS93_07825 [Sulfurimonas sp.]